MIVYEGFSKRYGTLRAVESLDLTIGAAEVVALLGPNGSGKTTALKAAAGLLRPTAGTVRIGAAGLPASAPEARRAISYLPQKVAFPDSCSGREIVDFYRALRGAPPERVGEALRFANLNGAGTRAVGTYSGGMTQRLGLAVAMLPQAPVLLLDEPTAALDPAGLEAFHRLAEESRGAGRAVFFTSHQLGDVERLADRFAVLVEGRLVAALTQRELQDRLSQRGALRVRLAEPTRAPLERLREIAPQSRLEGDTLVAPCPAAARPALLEALRVSGMELLSLQTEEGRLDDLYRELVTEATS